MPSSSPSSQHHLLPSSTARTGAAQLSRDRRHLGRSPSPLGGRKRCCNSPPVVVRSRRRGRDDHATFRTLPQVLVHFGSCLVVVTTERTELCRCLCHLDHLQSPFKTISFFYDVVVIVFAWGRQNWCLRELFTHVSKCQSNSEGQVVSGCSILQNCVEP